MKYTMEATTLKKMTEFVLGKVSNPGKIAVILGSGLGGFADQLTDSTKISYETIPHYPRSTVEGHSGELVFGKYKNISITAAKGRFHYYEGYELDTVTIPVHLFAEMGITTLLITNAAGSCRESIPPGSLMLINGHMDCTFREESAEPVMVIQKPYYDRAVLDKVRSVAKNLNVSMPAGVYCWTLGPAYETPAEISYIKGIGGDAVGMSTVPEIQCAAELGIRVIGISIITNFAAGITGEPLTHDEVIQTADQVKQHFLQVIGGIIKIFGDDN
jgi:purine-nucleoside phosphorylase